MFKAISFVVVGIGFLIAAAIHVQSTREFLHSSILVPGRVVKLNSGGSHPEIEFITQTGERISYPQGGLIFGMKVGDDVQVHYLSAAPSLSPTVDKFGAIWDTVIYLTFMGCAAIIAGLQNLPSRQ